MFELPHRDGIEKKVSQKVEKRFKQAIDLLGIDDLHQRRCKIFTVTGFDLFHAGSKHSIYGTYVGVPINYEYETPNDVPTSEIVIAGEQVNWNNSDLKKMFKESLILSEDEQIFGIMRELALACSSKFLLECLYPIVAVVGAYAMGHTINNRLQLFSRTRPIRIMMYSLVSLFIYGNYCFITDYTSIQYDTKVDKQIASLGDKWKKAGVGFYDKMLQKNIAIRTITGDNSKYSSVGNVNFFVRQKEMPLTLRKEFFEQQLKQSTSMANESIKA